MPHDSAIDRIRRKRRLAAAQKGACPWCKLPLPEDLADAQVDHIIPLARGGPDLSWNRQLLHRRCNIDKGTQLTPEAEALAEQHGIVLREPLPTAWPGSSVKLGSGKPNPYRAARDAEYAAARQGVTPPPEVKVTVRKVYEVECHACHCIIDVPDSYDAAMKTRREHAAIHRNEGATPAACTR